MTQPPDKLPDPWAVVEHHARAAAQGGDAALAPGQRLAMYASVAPQVIGARAMLPREAGPGGSRDARWVVNSPGGGPLLAFDASGKTWVASTPQAQRLLSAAAGFVIATALLTPVAGPRAIVPGLIMAAGVYALSGVFLPRWREVGLRAGDDKYEQIFAELAARYERAIPPGE